MYKEIKYMPAGDSSIVVEFGDSIKEEINSRIRNMLIGIENSNIEGIREVVPTYRSIAVLYDPSLILYDEIKNKLIEIEKNMLDSEEAPARVVELPTVYAGEYGPDLEFVAEHNGLTEEEVIKIHSEGKYLVYMLGFTPGFPYLGGMDEKIATPRLENPRTKIAAGAVGIAGSQTGVYPIESPGGWQLIGRTPLNLYAPLEDPPVLLNSGDYIKFVPVSEEEFLKIQKEVKEGTYKVKISGDDNE